MRKLPKDKSKPFTVNGMKFANREEYDKRYKADLDALAQLLYDIYQEKKRKERDDVAQSTLSDVS